MVTAKKNKSDDSWKASLITWFEIIKRLIQDATFIHPDPGPSKADKSEKMTQKHREAIWNLNKKGRSVTLRIKTS